MGEGVLSLKGSEDVSLRRASEQRLEGAKPVGQVEFRWGELFS